MKYIYLIICSFLIISCSTNPNLEKANSKKPKLVLGIVIDQMRPDYLTRYEKHFGEGGFKRLQSEGFYNRNVHYNYVPTFTGPGHASIFTGTTPATHGIIANDWFERSEGEYVYCAGDPSMQSIGTSSDKGEMSPHRLLSTTITDELLLASNFRSKVIGLSLKDRGAILPAGHNPTGAFWFDDKTGNFITSSYYTDELPEWLNTFNKRRLTDIIEDSVWQLSLPIEEYQASSADDMPYERRLNKKRSATFPYDLKELKSQYDDLEFIKKTPFGNSLLTEIAITALREESMGQGEEIDFMTLSYSSPDYIGHDAGPRSMEVEDTYIKLDKELESLLNELDALVGKGNYLVFLTADHAGADNPQYLMEKKIATGYYNKRTVPEQLDSLLDVSYGKGEWIEAFYNEQIYLNHKLISSKNLALEEVIDMSITFLLQSPGMSEVYSALDMRKNAYSTGMRMRLQMGYNFQRSGDILLVFKPAWVKKTSEATRHGSGYNYDTHVPLLWYGNNISPGESFKSQSITDIAPTLSFMLGTQLPNGADGQPILELLE